MSLRVPFRVALLLVFAPMHQAFSIIFPSDAEDHGRAYDHQHNAIRLPDSDPGHEVVWFRHDSMPGGIRIPNSSSGFLGAAIAPKWFITARHNILMPGGSELVSRGKTEVHDKRGKIHKIATWAEVPTKRPTDLILVQIDDVFEEYSALSTRRFITGVNPVCKVYGCSSSEHAGGYIRSGVTGKIAGRYYLKGAGSGAVRWGLAHPDTQTPEGYQWPFTPDDPALGRDCAGVASGDSGGPSFLLGGNVLTGITVAAIWDDGPLTTNASSSDCITARSYVWSTNGVYRCLRQGYPILAAGSALDIAACASNILAAIDSPIRVAAAGVSSQSVPGWTNLAFGLVATVPEGSRIDVSELGAKAAPAEVYHAASYIENNQPDSRIAFRTPPTLLRTERYTVRLHFAGVHFTASNQCFQRILINGKQVAARLDPVAGPNKPKAVDFTNIQPDSRNSIEVVIRPNNKRRAATLSGLEVFREQPPIARLR